MNVNWMDLLAVIINIYRERINLNYFRLTCIAVSLDPGSWVEYSIALNGWHNCPSYDRRYSAMWVRIVDQSPAWWIQQCASRWCTVSWPLERTGSLPAAYGTAYLRPEFAADRPYGLRQFLWIQRLRIDGFRSARIVDFPCLDCQYIRHQREAIHAHLRKHTYT